MADGGARHALSRGGGARHAPGASARLVRSARDGARDGAWEVDEPAVLAAVQRRATYYDRNGDFHYDLISALHKSMRGGDADGALYYCARMLAGGEDPRYVTRRLIRFASEDVGLADPGALLQAVAADQACHAIGMPECGVIIGQCAVYLALAPKSTAIYKAYEAAMSAAKDEPAASVPLHIRNAPTKMMAAIGYGKGYVYNPANSASECAASTCDVQYVAADKAACCGQFITFPGVLLLLQPPSVPPQPFPSCFIHTA